MTTTPAETAEAASVILESGAIMLGAALVFVTVFRQLKLGATLGYIVAGALIGPYLLGLIQDPEKTLSLSEIGFALLLLQDLVQLLVEVVDVEAVDALVAQVVDGAHARDHAVAARFGE